MYGGTAELLKAYNVTVNPPQNDWVEVEGKLFFRQVRPVPFRPPLFTVSSHVE